jgi:hypothetical protein
MLVVADPVRRDVLEHEARVRARLQLAPGSRDAGLRIDDDRPRLDDSREWT